MNELLTDVRFWFITMGAGLLALVKYLWNKQDRETRERFSALELDVVRRKEFDAVHAHMTKEHEENSIRLDRIEDGIAAMHKRMDGLYRDLIGRSNER